METNSNNKLYGNCKICNNPVNFKGSITCSRKCSDTLKKIENRENRVCKLCSNSFIEKKSVTRNFCSKECRETWQLMPENIAIRINASKNALLDKYGVPTMMETETFHQKAKEKKAKKYGDENYNNMSKNFATKEERYGDKNYNNFEKIKKTKQEKHGNANYNNRDLANQTSESRYGTKYPIQLAKYKDQVKQTCIEKFGVSSPLKNKEILNKLKATNLERYGVEIASKNEKIKKKIKETHIDKFSEMKIYTKMQVANLTLLEEFDGCKINGLFRSYMFSCNICSNIFEGTFNNNHAPICRKCFPCNKTNRLQRTITEFLDLYKIHYIENTRRIISPLEIDIFIPSHNLGIECDGNYFHSEIKGETNKTYHLNKSNEAFKKGIKLIHLFEDEIMFNFEIVKSRLLNELGLIKNKIFARKCIIKAVSSKDKNAFLIQHHIQGKDSASINLGLYYNNNIVSIMTFSKPRISLGNKKSIKNDEIYELVRFCALTDYIVVGGFQKLFKFFINEYSPKKIITYADIRYSGLEPSKTVYIKSGFNFINFTPPNYYYFTKNNYLTRIHRFSFTRKRLLKILNDEGKTPENINELTEFDMAQLLGMDRIWNCGNMKFEFYNFERKTHRSLADGI